MLLSALLLAAAVQAAPPPRSMNPTPRGRVTVYASKDEAIKAMKAREACREPSLQLAEWLASTVTSRVTPLGDLPPANHTLAVLRSIDGCPVSSTIRFNVDRPAGR